MQTDLLDKFLHMHHGAVVGAFLQLHRIVRRQPAVADACKIGIGEILRGDGAASGLQRALVPHRAAHAYVVM